MFYFRIPQTHVKIKDKIDDRIGPDAGFGLVGVSMGGIICHYYLQERGEGQVRLISDELKMLWGKPQTVHTVRRPLFIRVARL